jgi:hypothetical protein
MAGLAVSYLGHGPTIRHLMISEPRPRFEALNGPLEPGTSSQSGRNLPYNPNSSERRLRLLLYLLPSPTNSSPSHNGLFFLFTQRIKTKTKYRHGDHVISIHTLPCALRWYLNLRTERTEHRSVLLGLCCMIILKPVHSYSRCVLLLCCCQPDSSQVLLHRLIYWVFLRAGRSHYQPNRARAP